MLVEDRDTDAVYCKPPDLLCCFEAFPTASALDKFAGHSDCKSALIGATRVALRGQIDEIVNATLEAVQRMHYREFGIALPDVNGSVSQTLLLRITLDDRRRRWRRCARKRARRLYQEARGKQ